ncbi:MAG: hypothetical protein K5919_05170 [Clostridiales bacterium]|nr:hypothetical protein [Clostridiales bacterium]
MKNAPCKGCEDRRLGCHGKCEKYRAWRAGMDQAARRRQLEHAADDANIQGVMRSKKYHWNMKGRKRDQ